MNSSFPCVVVKRELPIEFLDAQVIASEGVAHWASMQRKFGVPIGVALGKLQAALAIPVVFLKQAS